MLNSEKITDHVFDHGEFCNSYHNHTVVEQFLLLHMAIWFILPSKRLTIRMRSRTTVRAPMIDQTLSRFSTFLFSFVNPLRTHVMVRALDDIRSFLHKLPTELLNQGLGQMFRPCHAFSKNILVRGQRLSIACNDRPCARQDVPRFWMNMSCTLLAERMSTLTVLPMRRVMGTYFVQSDCQHLLR